MSVGLYNARVPHCRGSILRPLSCDWNNVIFPALAFERTEKAEKKQFTQFYEYNSMPNPDDRHCNRSDVSHTKVNAVERARRLPCPLSECQTDRMPLKPLKWPTMSRTSLDHGLRWPGPTIDFLSRIHAAIFRFCSIICSLLWRVASVPWCPNVTPVQFRMFGPRILNISLPSIPTNRTFDSHCVWDLRRLNIHFLRIWLHFLHSICCRKRSFKILLKVFELTFICIHITHHKLQLSLTVSNWSRLVPL